MAQESRPAAPATPADARIQVRALIESRRPGAALELLDPLLKANPRDALLRALEAEALYALEQTERAVAAFEQAVALDPMLAGRLYHLGIAYQQQGRLESAERIFQAVRAEPEARLQAKGCLGLGLNRLLAGQEAEAETLFEESLALDADAVPPRYQLALLALKRNDAERAEGLLRRVLASDPLHHGAAYNLALICARSERAAEAERLMAQYRRVLAGKERITELTATFAQAPRDASAAAAIAAVHASLGSWRDAEAWYRAALEIDPENATSLLGLAEAVERLGRAGEAAELRARAKGEG